MMDESSMINLQDMISNMMPKRNKRRKVTYWGSKENIIRVRGFKTDRHG